MSKKQVEYLSLLKILLADTASIEKIKMVNELEDALDNLFQILLSIEIRFSIATTGSNNLSSGNSPVCTTMRIPPRNVTKSRSVSAAQKSNQSILWPVNENIGKQQQTSTKCPDPLIRLWYIMISKSLWVTIVKSFVHKNKRKTNFHYLFIIGPHILFNSRYDSIIIRRLNAQIYIRT